MSSLWQYSSWIHRPRTRVVMLCLPNKSNRLTLYVSHKQSWSSLGKAAEPANKTSIMLLMPSKSDVRSVGVLVTVLDFLRMK